MGTTRTHSVRVQVGAVSRVEHHGRQAIVCRVTHVVIVGGGPGGYEAALVGAQLGADVTLVDRDGLGGSAVITDCVPSKTLIATAEVMNAVEESGELGVRLDGHGELAASVSVDLGAVNARVKKLAASQSTDIGRRLADEGVHVVVGTGRLDGADRVVATTGDGDVELSADAILVATGAHPRVLDSAQPDGERILTWEQVYDLDAAPERLIVIGSGVTGLEFASAYNALGVDVVLVSSRERVLPGEDADAAQVIEDVLTRRGMTLLSTSRARSVKRTGDDVAVTLVDGRVVEGSHCLLAVGSVPNTERIGLETAGVERDGGDNICVDKVSRTTGRGIYAAGDCTGVLMLASVAAMQGRIAMWHALGDAVAPLDLKTVSSTVFTAPEIATVGWSQRAVDAGEIDVRAVTLQLAGNARAKMQGARDGFVKLFCRPGTGIVVGGVVVAPRASELIHPVALAVEARLTVDELAHGFTVYPSMSGSLAEAARRLHSP
ncbi:MAG: NAD(P)H-quinone dehydrogenase [Propionibacteriales bacterium]|nr:NAD(P)H-quinone dehydrogenase [Propionibacteriales bacterium]